MRTLTLYSFRRCPFAIRVRVVLEEKGIPYTLVEENLSQLSPELLSMHPEGRVPLLVVNLGENRRQVIYQSTIITEYLDEAFADVGGKVQSKLMPQDPFLRAEVRLWTYGCDHIFKPDLDLHKYERPSLSPEDLLALDQRLHLHFQKWEAALQSSPFLVGGQLSLADIHLFPFARQFMRCKAPLPGVQVYTRVAQWLDTMVQRPSFERAMFSTKR